LRMDARAARAPLRLQAHPGVQFSASDGGRDRLGARLISAPPRPAQRPFARRQGGGAHAGDRCALRGGGDRRRHDHRRAPAGPAGPGTLYWRVTQWTMPFHTMIPPYGDNALNGHAWVPIDDENCMSWCFTHHPTRPLSDAEVETMRNGGGIHVTLIPGTFRPVVNKDNDYMI